MHRHLEKIVSFAVLASSVQGACVAKRATPAGYTALGCFDWSSPALSSAYSLADQPDVTYDKCSAKCEASGATYFGIAEGYTCYCGSSLVGQPKSASANDCWYRCSGDATQWCGGPGKIDLFSKGGADAAPIVPPSTAVTVPNPGPTAQPQQPQPQPTTTQANPPDDPYTSFTSVRTTRSRTTARTSTTTSSRYSPPPQTSTRDYPQPQPTSTRDYPPTTSTRDYPSTTTQSYPRTTQQTPTYDGSGQICLTIGRDYTCFSVPTGATVVSGPGLTFDPVNTRMEAKTTAISWGN